MKNIFFAVIVASTVLPFLASGQVKDTSFHANYKWETSMKLESLQGEELKQPSVILFDKRINEYLYNEKGELERYVIRHKKVHINESKDVEDYNKIYLPAGNVEGFDVVNVRTINKAGKIIEQGLKDFKEVEEEGAKYKILAVEGLEPGGEFESLSITKTEISRWGSERFQTAAYIRTSFFEIISPENLKFEAKSYNGYGKPVDTITNGVRTLIASKEKIVALEKEDYTYQKANSMRLEFKMAYNYSRDHARMDTWSDAGKRYYEFMHEASKDDIKAVKKFIGVQKIKGASDEESVRNLENYIKTNIAFQEQSSSESSTLAGMLKNKYSTKFGILKLYFNSLDQLSIPYEIVITSDRTEKPFDGAFDTWNFLEEVIVYLPGLKKFLYPEDNDYRLGMIPSQYIYTEGLFIKELAIGETRTGLATVKRIPGPASWESNKDDLEEEVSFDPKMKEIKMHLRHGMYGYQALNIRPAYNRLKEDKRKELTEAILKSYSPDAKITNGKTLNFDINSDDINKPLVFEGDLAVGSVMEKAGEKYIFKVGLLIGEQHQMYQEKPRQQKIDLGFPHGYNRIIKVHIPEGYTVSGLETIKFNIVHNDDSGKPQFGFVSDYKMTGNDLEINIKEYYDNECWPIALFQKYREVINAAADFNKVSLVFVKK